MIALSAASGKGHYQKSDVFAHPENQTLETMKRLQAETAVGQKLKVRKLKIEMESALLDRAFCGQPQYHRRARGPGGRRPGERTR